MTEEKMIPDNECEKNENEAEHTVEDINELDSSIIRQVEYYFGDSNLPRDKFLSEQVKLDDGWVPLDILLKFNRLAKLTTDVEVIATALNKSTSGLLEVSEDKKKIRRNPSNPLPEMNEERRKDLQNRTIYAKGFPKNSTLDEILKYFKQFEEVESIIMRRYLDKASKKKLFKGSIFATFKTMEQAEKFLNTKGHKYEETELLVHWQKEYHKIKDEEYNARKENKTKKNKNGDVKEKVDKEEFKLPTGTVLHFCEAHNKTMRENIKDALTPLGAEIAYIDFKSGDTEGWVRLSKENSVKDIFDKFIDGKMKIGESEMKFRVLEGEEEKQYLDKTIEEISRRRKGQKNNRSNKGKNFKGKQGKKRKQGQHEDAPTAKVKASES